MFCSLAVCLCGKHPKHTGTVCIMMWWQSFVSDVNGFENLRLKYCVARFSHMLTQCFFTKCCLQIKVTFTIKSILIAFCKLYQMTMSYPRTDIHKSQILTLNTRKNFVSSDICNSEIFFLQIITLKPPYIFYGFHFDLIQPIQMCRKLSWFSTYHSCSDAKQLKLEYCIFSEKIRALH